MILPDKYLSLQNSLIYLGGKLLGQIDDGLTISSLWDIHRKLGGMPFNLFVLTLDYLFLIQAIEYKDGVVRKNSVTTC